MNKFFPLLLLALTLTACGTKKANNEEVNSEELISEEFDQFDEECCCCPHFHLRLQPLGDFSQKEAQALAEVLDEKVGALNDSMHAIVEVLPAKPLPTSAYSAKCHRYRGGKILDTLTPVRGGHSAIIALTHKDISTSHRGREDWGVLGLSFTNSRKAVVSTFRVKPKSDLWKVVCHEYLHSIGFPHCPADNPRCIMQDGHGHGNFRGKQNVCDACWKKFL